jgi:Ser/Thr protein kinase RdoA (MazF antagonist)
MSLETMADRYQQRTGYKGDIGKVTRLISQDFNLGNVVTSHVIPIGYEDYNLCLETDQGKYFVKVFSTLRTDADCKRNVRIVEKALDAGAQVPPLMRSSQGYLWMKSVNGTKLRLCVMECIDGKDYFSAGSSPSIKDIRTIARQAALINTIDLRPAFIYDSWAIVNFPSEFKEKKQYLPAKDLKWIQPLFYQFKKANIKKLPHCFVHGDIIRTNVVKDKKGRNWIVDFSVANYYPRIQELAVLACDICFDPSSKRNSEKKLSIALEEYQKIIALSEHEHDMLPLFIKVAHAMHVLCGTYEREAKSNTTRENEYFIEKGRAGLNQML